MKKITKICLISLFALAMLFASLICVACAPDSYEDSGNNNSSSGSTVCDHEFGTWGNSTATCTHAGKEKRKCSLCDYEEERDVAKKDHSFTTYVADNNADCITKATATALCDNGCGKKDSKIVGDENPNVHNSDDFKYFINQTDDNKHDISHDCCGAFIETVNHEFDSYVSNNDATCSADGTETAVCLCGKDHTRTDEGTATGVHSTYIAKRIHNDCENDGKNVIKCSTCDTYSEEKITSLKTGHTISSWKIKSQSLVNGETCVYEVTYVGYCSVCNEEEAETQKEYQTVHTYSCTITSEANCKIQGVKTYTCTKGCLESTKTENYTALENHDWIKEGEVINGVQKYTCNNGCGKTKNVIEATTDTHTIDKSTLSTNELKLKSTDSVCVGIQLDNTTLNLLSDGNVSLSAKVLDDTSKQAAMASLTEAQKTLLGNKPVYDFTIMQNSTAVSNFNGGKVRVAIDYTPAVGEDTDNLVIWHLSSTGLEVISATYVNGQAVFYTTHFSNFVVATVDNEDACLANGHEFIYGDKIEATCITGGYTEATCAHCGKAVITDVTFELGHDYNGTPTETSKTCTIDGKYTYTCKREGCNHTMELPIPASHNYVMIEYKSPTCKEGGFRKEKCLDCQDERTVELEKLNYHNMKTEYKLLEGATSCIDGLVYYEICREEGCGHKTDYIYVNDHLSVYKFSGVEDYPEYNIELLESIDLKELLPDYYEYAYPQEYDGLIKIYKATCLCGEICGQVEFSDSSLFSGSNFYINEGDVWGGDEQEFTSQPIYAGMMTPNLDTFKLKFVITEEKNGCDKSYTLTITLKSEDGTQTLLNKSYVLKEGVMHGIEVTEYTMITPNTKCCDGVKETVTCSDCSAVLRGCVYSSDNERLHYNYIEKSISLSAYGSQEHLCNIVVSSCPCGEKIDYKIKPTSGVNRCSFTTNTIDGNTTEYVCDCGIRYVKRLDDYKDDNCYLIQKTTLLYNYDAESGEYLNSVVGYLSHFGYHHRWSDEEFVQIGDSCYYSWTETCLDCDKPSNGITSRHQLETTETYDSNGNQTIRNGCKNCDYHSLTVRHSSSNNLREYSVVYEYSENIKTVYTKTYTLHEKVYDGVSYFHSVPSIETVFAYSIDTNEVVSWEKTMYMLKLGTDKLPCMLIEYRINSLGESSVFENTCCMHTIDVYEESTCTKQGISGFLCVLCGGLGNGYYFEPNHILVGDSMTGYTCDRCGFSHEEDTYNHSVLIEKLEETDSKLKVGYFNKYNSESTLIDGTTRIVLSVLDPESGAYAPQTLEGDFITDNGVGEYRQGTINVDKTAIDTALTALNLQAGTEYKIFFEVLTNYGNELRIELS